MLICIIVMYDFVMSMLYLLRIGTILYKNFDKLSISLTVPYRRENT